MKKLLALLMACATMTCVFASCGDEKEESSANDTSVSESSDTETTTEEETTEETTEATTEEETVTTEESAETTTVAVETPTYEFIEDADKTPFIGKWECEKYIVEGEEMKDLMGIPLYAVFQFNIKEDGTATMAESMAQYNDTGNATVEEATNYTWGVVGDNEIVIYNSMGLAVHFTLDGESLVGATEGTDEQIYLVKVDEFTPFDMEEFMNSFQIDGVEDTSDIAGDITTESETSEAVESESSESVAPSAE